MSIVSYGIMAVICYDKSDSDGLPQILALGSYWAVIPSVLCIPMNVFRIKSEEEILLRELQGYGEYCLKTRYRLIPFIW